MVYLQNGMSLGTKKNEVLGKHAEGKKLGTKGHVYDSVYLKCPKQAHLQAQKIDEWFLEWCGEVMGQ